MKPSTTLHTITALVCLLGLSGCVVFPPYKNAKFHEPDHATANKAGVDYPPITLKVVEKRLMTTPAKGGMGGYWLSVTTEDPEIAKAIPKNESFLKGTYLLGVAPGRTKAFYGNAATLHDEPRPTGLAFVVEVIEGE